MMERVIVIGSPGSGKSSFARKLHTETGIPLYYLDMLWHKPDRTTVPQEEFDARLQVILDQDRWIMDGNYQRTLEKRLTACDTVFLLDIPTEICIAGVEARIGREREDMPWVETEFDEEFRQYIMEFSQARLPQIYALLEKHRDRKNIVIFKSRKEADRYNILRSGNTANCG